MNGRAQKGRDRLERIAALLLSLAGLAEHAATRAAEAGRLPDAAGISAWIENMARIVLVPKPTSPAAGERRDTS